MTCQYYVVDGEFHGEDHHLMILVRKNKHYGRDRGENDVSPLTCNDWSGFINKCRQEYNYLFSNGEWWVECNGSRETGNDRLKRMYTAEEIRQIKQNIKRY